MTTTKGEYSSRRQHVRAKKKKKCILTCVDTGESETMFIEILNHSKDGLGIIYDDEKLSVGNKVYVHIEPLNISKKEAEVVWLEELNGDRAAGLRWAYPHN